MPAPCSPFAAPVDWQPSALTNGDVAIRPITVADAAFSLALRTDDAMAQHLSSTAADLGRQEAWLTQYKQREADRTEFYFIIEHQHQAVGTVRLYDFQPLPNGQASFCWGSWIILPQAPHYTALKSALLVYYLGFDLLQFHQCHFDVRRQNHKVISFHQKMGATPTRESEQDVFFTYTPEAYRACLHKFSKYVQGIPV
jgi:RimJ/RimL family protein N-acetyltransferase